VSVIEQSDIKDINLADEGQLRIEWAGNSMQVLKSIKERFEKEKPLAGVRMGASLHITTETANLLKTVKAGGAEIFLCGSNPFSTRDDVAASLVRDEEIPVFAFFNENTDEYYRHIREAVANDLNVIMDDGADMIATINNEFTELSGDIIGGIEETTTGVIRLRNMAKEGVLKFPVIAANDSHIKYLFDNRYGTGQSSLDGIIRATNILIAGSTFVVNGFGWCGRGVATRARGLGANVIVTEVDPLKALEAVMEGFTVMPMEQAAAIGDIFLTATGNKGIIRSEHFELMKNGAILANTGHFDVEIDVAGLISMSASRRKIRYMVEEFSLKSGKKLYLLAEGRLVGQSAAEAHPASIMDLTFACQALAVEYLVKNKNKLKSEVTTMPESINQEIAKVKLDAMGIGIDQLTDEQTEYLNSWSIGT
jgi:adenosylhomocysteinase